MNKDVSQWEWLNMTVSSWLYLCFPETFCLIQPEYTYSLSGSASPNTQNHISHQLLTELIGGLGKHTYRDSDSITPLPHHRWELITCIFQRALVLHLTSIRQDGTSGSEKCKKNNSKMQFLSTNYTILYQWLFRWKKHWLYPLKSIFYKHLFYLDNQEE